MHLQIDSVRIGGRPPPPPRRITWIGLRKAGRSDLTFLQKMSMSNTNPPVLQSLLPPSSFALVAQARQTAKVEIPFAANCSRVETARQLILCYKLQLTAYNVYRIRSFGISIGLSNTFAHSNGVIPHVYVMYCTVNYTLFAVRCELWKTIGVSQMSRDVRKGSFAFEPKDHQSPLRPLKTLLPVPSLLSLSLFLSLSPWGPRTPTHPWLAKDV